jgi:hypothetical protein
VYSVFIYPDVILTRAIALGDHGEITHVIDDKGEATAMHTRVTPKVTDSP